MIRGFKSSRVSENSRIFRHSRRQKPVTQFSSLVDPLLTAPLAFGVLIPRQRKAIQVMKPIPGTLQAGGRAFQTTHWTLVLHAGQSDPTETAREALSDFCEAYWPPLYTFLRLRGHASPEAQDLLQGFFAHLLEKNTLSRADKEKGRLRTFLLGSLQNFLYNEYDRAAGSKEAVVIELCPSTSICPKPKHQ